MAGTAAKLAMVEDQEENMVADDSPFSISIIISMLQLSWSEIVGKL